MDHSILEDIKTLIGPDIDDDFDTDLIIHINTVLGILNQVGVGPTDGFAISGSQETWEQFIGNAMLLSEARSFVYLKVRLMFDPPSSAAAIENMQKLCDELIWRIQVKADKT
jgi:hypothetical protein